MLCPADSGQRPGGRAERQGQAACIFISPALPDGGGGGEAGEQQGAWSGEPEAETPGLVCSNGATVTTAPPYAHGFTKTSYPFSAPFDEGGN